MSTAALRGANVVGSDLTPAMFDAARARAAAAGVDLEWVEADAESLPFQDGRFDVVTSTFGHMFAPQHAVAAGPGLVATAMLGDTWAQVCRERRALQGEFITPIDGGYRLRQDYLVTIGRKPA